MTPQIMQVISKIINATEIFSLVLFNWFIDNFMKANSNKSHLLMRCEETTHTNIDGTMIKPSQKETLLSIKFDSELKFEDHVNFMCEKANKRICTPARIALFMDSKEKRKIMKPFVKSQFGYYPLL